MSTRRWAGASLGLLMGCFVVAAGCGADDGPPSNTPDGGGGGGGDSSSACSTTAVVSGCNKVTQNGVEFDLGCSTIVNRSINGRPVCATSGQCAGTPTPCLDPMTVRSCLSPTCAPPPRDGGGDAGSSVLGTACKSDTDCGGGLTCVKPTDNVTPGAGPPNGLCTMDCSASMTNPDLCKSLGGTCLKLTEIASKSFCVELCTTGKVSPPESKCHGRLDMVCSELLPSGFGCVPVCATDSDCGTRKCDLGTGLCTDVVTPGSPIGSPCMLDTDCAGRFCYPYDNTATPPTPGVCTAICRLGNLEGCGFRTSPLDAGPPVGACLLATSAADLGDIAICAQLCDSINDCTETDPRWTCNLDPDVRSGFGHNGYCWLGMRPDGGARDAAAPDTGGRETGAPETGAPETSAPEASADTAPEAASDTPADSTTDGATD